MKRNCCCKPDVAVIEALFSDETKARTGIRGAALDGRVVACVGGLTWAAGGVQRLLVHVLANRSGVPQKTANEEQSRFSGRGEEGAITRTVGIRGRFSRWLVPAYSEGSTAAHRARVEAKACG